VGQATERVDDGRNGFLAAVEGVDELAEAVRRIALGEVDVEWIRKNGSETARRNDFRELDTHWRNFLAGWVL
jgi:glycosyltransferase involved in cell wall biosynthesis